jgi:hypothetical protein
VRRKPGPGITSGGVDLQLQKVLYFVEIRAAQVRVAETYTV